MRRLTTWILIVALALLALCLVWLLPRLLRKEAPPEQNIAAVPSESASDLAIHANPPPSTPPEPDSSSLKSEIAPPSTAPPDRESLRGSPEPSVAASSIRGRVLDRAGKSVPGVLVLAAHAPDLGAPVREEDFWISHLPLDVADPAGLGAESPAHTTTDSLGIFRFDRFEPGRVRIAIRSPRHAPLDRNDLRIGSGQDLDAGDFVLDAPAWIEASLLDADGVPVRDTTVVASDPMPGSTLPALAAARGVALGRSEVRGRIHAGPLVAGPHRLVALGGAKFEDVEIAVPDAAAGGEYLATLSEADRITGRLILRGSSSGDLVVRALPAETARGPVPYEVRADSRTAKVQRDGSFEIEGIARDTLYELRAGSELDRFEDVSTWCPPAFAFAGEPGVRVRCGAAATVAFDLVDGAGGSAPGLARADLEHAFPARAALASATTTAPTNAQGRREISNVRPTRFPPWISLLVQSRGYAPLARTVEVEPGSTADLGILAMQALPRLDVRVVDAATGEAVRGARVVPTETPAGADPSGLEPEAVLTDAAGEARVVSYSGAASRVEVQAPGFARATRAGPFGFGYGTPRIDVGLVRGATARIVVLDESGSPIPGARVEWVEGDWTPPARATPEAGRSISERPDPKSSRLTDAEGRVAFAAIAPGRHAFLVQRRRPPYLDGEWTQRELREGEVQEIELRSRAPASLDLRIVDGGVPLAGAPVCLLRAEDAARALDPGELENVLPPGIDARLDARGRAVFRNLDAPAVDVLALLVEGQHRRACFPISVRAGEGSFTLDVAASAVSGDVVDVQKKPVAGAEILVVDEAREAELRTRGRRKTLLDGGASALAALGFEHVAATTDADGRFRLVGLQLDRPFSLVARVAPDDAAASATGRSAPVTLRHGEGGFDVRIDVAPAGSLEIRPRSSPDLGPCTLVATPARESRSLEALPRVRRVCPGRREVLYGLVPGAWDLAIVTDEGQVRDRLHVDVEANGLRAVDVRLP